MDKQLEAQLERLRVAEKENAELKRMIDELEAELDIDFEVREEDRPARGGWGCPDSWAALPGLSSAHLPRDRRDDLADDLLPPLPPSTS